MLNNKAYVTVKRIRSGEFKNSKVPWVALEVVSVDTVGNQYQVKTKDAHEDTIEASLHSSCKEIVQLQVRKGRILLI